MSNRSKGRAAIGHSCGSGLLNFAPSRSKITVFGGFAVRKLLLAALLVFALALAGGEAFARYYLQLGDPPLTIADPDIEYMFKPDQDVSRFGNRIFINHWGMRSPQIERTPPPSQHRTLVLGDSVVNGGNLSDQSSLATTLLSTGERLFLNVSAGSWGPENMLAYVKKFGLFGADRLVLVLSTHDASDVPTFAPLDPDTHPTETPSLALVEAVTRYLPRYFPDSGSPAVATEEQAPAPSALAAVSALLAALPNSCLVLHPTLSEFRSGHTGAGYAALREAAAGAVIVDEMPLVAEGDYRDDIHHSDAGQRTLAKAISGCFD